MAWDATLTNFRARSPQSDPAQRRIVITELTQKAQSFANYARQFARVRTGYMRSQIGNPVANERDLSVTVTMGADYTLYVNARFQFIQRAASAAGVNLRLN